MVFYFVIGKMSSHFYMNGVQKIIMRSCGWMFFLAFILRGLLLKL